MKTDSEIVDAAIAERNKTYKTICFYRAGLVPVEYDTRTTCKEIIITEKGSWARIDFNGLEFEIWEGVPYKFAVRKWRKE